MATAFFSSIRFRILLLILISSIPAWGLIYFIAQEQRNSQIENMRSSSLHETVITADMVGRIIENARTLLISASSVIEAHESDRAFTMDFMSQLLKQFPYYNNIATSDASGNLKRTVLPARGPVNYKDRLWFKRVAETQAFSIGEYVFGRVTKTHIITLAYPIRGKKGVFKGAVFISIDLNWLAGQLRAVSLPPDATLSVVDSNGFVLAMLPGQEDWVGKKFPEPDILQTILKKRKGTEESADRERIYSFAPVAGTSGHIFVTYGISKVRALSLIEKTLIRNMLLLGIVFAAAIAGTLLLGNLFIMGRVRKLVAAAERLGRGELNARTALPHGRDELNQIAQALDETAEKLDENETARMAAVDTLHAEKNKLESIIGAMTSSLTIRDREYNLIYQSPLALKHFGNRLGEKCYCVFSGIDEVCEGCPVALAFGDGKVHSAVRSITMPDGTTSYSYNVANPIRDASGEIVSCLEISTDITEQRHAEVALMAAEKRFRELLENIQLIAVMLDCEGNITFCNDFFLRTSGWSREEALGKNWFDLFIPKEREGEIRSLFSRVVSSGDLVRHYENPIVTRSGAQRQIVWDNVVLRDPGGGIVGIASVGIDVTEHRLLEESLRRSEKMEALGTLAGGVAHDLNNVLGVSLGYAELLQEKVPPGSSLRTYVDNIFSSTERGASIIQDLLTLARRGVSSTKVLDLNATVNAVLNAPEFERLRNFHPLTVFNSHLDGDLLNIKGSPVHLEKTVFNLLSNAAEAMSGRGEVTIRTENRYLDRPVHGYDMVKEGDYAVLIVSDTGKGIRSDDLKKIFEPFYTKKAMGRSGTGLGLAIVWGTLKDHDGYVDVQSIEGRGTTFTLYFPVTREKAADDGTKIPMEEYLGRGETVLVVDDIKGQRDVACSLLERLGYRVHAAAGGEEAVEYLKVNKADIMVLDMIMEPGIDGLETYRQVKEINPGQKAVIVSGFSATDRLREALSLGAGAYVKKPYIMERIGMAIRQELDKKR